MIILIGSKIGQSDIQASLGKPEYSYYFLLREFLPALRRIGTVIEAEGAADVDRLYDAYHDQGKPVVFLSFSPPQQTPVELRCPTLCVFAWEFDDLPDQAWDGDPRNDWRHVFERIAAAVPCSEETARAVSRAMGPEFPVRAIPAPVWSRFADLYPQAGWSPRRTPRPFEFTGRVIDSPRLGLSADALVRKPEPPVEIEPEKEPEVLPEPECPPVEPPGPLSWAERRLISRTLWREWWYELTRGPGAKRPEAPAPVVEAPVPVEVPPVLEPEPEPEPETPPDPYPLGAQRLTLEGVVYVSVLNPGDGRKNWIDLITAFCWAFKDVEDATLVVKMTHHDLEYYRIVLLTLLSRLAPFRCRVLVLHGFLEEAEYRALVEASTFYVNASACEGLCLPLMEFLSAGKPVIAPRHTAMLDYLTADLGFIVETCPEPSCWSHDPTGLLRTRRHRLNWQSLMEAYRASYRLARENPRDYRRMSTLAHRHMQAFCSVEQVAARLSDFLETLPQSSTERRAPRLEHSLP
ncbi:glycosyltransferase [Pseudomonas sp. RIT-PI-AD]|uniref:glycosyltransferase n=1 Tax=Pseudomonas sp. RIT-PI-AD TaxID=3035294 RepID=UPI0021DAE541|nr:glycosyltransferase [Pseudomonas sp. RIT-PI-AD]